MLNNCLMKYLLSQMVRCSSVDTGFRDYIRVRIDMLHVIFVSVLMIVPQNMKSKKL